MTAYKKLLAGFGCRDGKAILRGSSGASLSFDMLALAKYYSDNGADELYIQDLSETDMDHERTIGLVKEIIRVTDIPVMLGGRVKRLEDIKKYLYTGAKATWLDMSREDNIDLIKEAADRFGSEKIYAWFPELSNLDRAEEFEQLGAAGFILDVPQLTKEAEAMLEQSEHPVIAASGTVSLDDISDMLSFQGCEGVILPVTDELSDLCMELKQQLKMQSISVDTFESSVAWSDFKLNSDGLVPAVVQDYKTGEVLMLAYMNEESFQATLKTGKMTYFSRSRQSLWCKGETSGHLQYVKALYLDCDNDTILAKVAQVGAACHTGARSCFFQTLAAKEYKETNPLKVFEDVFGVILDRKENPKEGSYTNYLFDKGIDKILKKVGEEATEIVIAAKNPDPEEIKYEISDFLYHVMVLMAEKGISWEEITKELANR